MAKKYYFDNKQLIFEYKPEIHGSLNDGYLYHFHDLLDLIHVWYRIA